VGKIRKGRKKRSRERKRTTSGAKKKCGPPKKGKTNLGRKKFLPSTEGEKNTKRETLQRGVVIQKGGETQLAMTRVTTPDRKVGHNCKQHAWGG